MKNGVPRCWAVFSQEGLKLVVILPLSSGSCEMMQQHLPRQHSFTISIISLEMLPFRVGISSVCVSKSSLKVQGPALKSVIKCTFSRERCPSWGEGNPSLCPSSPCHLCQVPCLTPVSHCGHFSIFAGAGFCSAPWFEFAARGILLPLPAHCLPKSAPHSPDHSNSEIPSSVQRFSLSPVFSHKNPPCLNPISVC